MFVATETARDVRELARQMRRSEVKAASVAYATVDELSPRRGSGRRSAMRARRSGRRTRRRPRPPNNTIVHGLKC